jgi:hypothetical protein
MRALYSISVSRGPIEDISQTEKGLSEVQFRRRKEPGGFTSWLMVERSEFEVTQLSEQELTYCPLIAPTLSSTAGLQSQV